MSSPAFKHPPSRHRKSSSDSLQVTNTVTERIRKSRVQQTSPGSTKTSNNNNNHNKNQNNSSTSTANKQDNHHRKSKSLIPNLNDSLYKSSHCHYSQQQQQQQQQNHNWLKGDSYKEDIDDDNMITRPSISKGLPPFVFPHPSSPPTCTDPDITTTTTTTTTTTAINQQQSFHQLSSLSSDILPFESANWLKLPPRTNWNVQDNNLKPLPAMFPPPIPTNSTFVSDASPSIVACRISECLRRRNALAEYDEDAGTASVFTSDRVNFSIHLYKGGKGKKSIRILDNKVKPDFSHGVIVECLRIQGDTISFGRECVAVLKSARGDGSGIAETKTIRTALQRTAPLGLERYNSYEPSSHFHEKSMNDKIVQETASLSLSSSNHHLPNPSYTYKSKKEKEGPIKVYMDTCSLLEHANILLNKDRLDAQRLGMERLVMMTDTTSSKQNVALLSSLCVLGLPLALFTKNQEDKSLPSIHEKLRKIIIQKEVSIPNIVSTDGGHGIHDEVHDDDDDNTQNYNAKYKEGHGLSSSDKNNIELMSNHQAKQATSHNPEDEEQAATMNFFAMHAICNALRVLSAHVEQLPKSKSSPLFIKEEEMAHLTNIEFLSGIISNLQGAARPPSLYVKTAHEASMAALCIQLLAKLSKTAKCNLITMSAESSSAPSPCDQSEHGMRLDGVKHVVQENCLEILIKARMVGSASHALLEREAYRACEALVGSSKSST